MSRYYIETVVGFFVFIGILCVGFMTVHLGKLQLFSDDSYILHAGFSSVSGLRVGSPVEINGIQVGTVRRLAMDQERQVAMVDLAIRKGIRVYDDAAAALKTSGLIGDRYVRVEPGGGGSLLKPGETITETTAPLDIEELVGKYVFGDASKAGKKETK